MPGLASHAGRSTTPPPMATRLTLEPAAPKTSRVRVATPVNGNVSPPQYALKAVTEALAGKDATELDVFTDASPKLPGSLLAPSSMARMINSKKSKEVDSGVKEWETTNYDPTMAGVPVLSARNSPTQTALSTDADGMTPMNAKDKAQYIIELNAAQHVYPARFSVFVGNLPAYLSDEILIRMVLHKFNRYGTVYGVVYRTKSSQGDKPWAILQFTNADDAAHAVGQSKRSHHKGETIGERFVRTDYCQAKRSIYVVSSYGPQYT